MRETSFKRKKITIENSDRIDEYDIFLSDPLMNADEEYMITNYDVVNVYDNVEEFKKDLIKLILK